MGRQSKFQRHQSVVRTQTEEEIITDDTVFSADVTPLIFSAQKNQMDIVKLLLSMGETIEDPHDVNCKCAECAARGYDEIRWAKTRLTCYRALSSAVYIVLQSQDPFLRAFQLSNKLNQLSVVEKYYKVGTFCIKAAYNITWVLFVSGFCSVPTCNI